LSYQALYRAWRPQTFADIVGQPHVKQTLTHAITRNQVAHAYLFSGPRGTGKTSAAKVLAKAVNCLSRSGAEPCNTCIACTSIVTGNNVDVEEIDAASNRGVDEIRQLRDKVQYAPATLTRKVYIIDEVHMLTTEAFNALLKTLEEPPNHTLFVLATTEPHKIPGTIVSRCQRFDFRRISDEEIIEHLKSVCVKEQWEYEEEALWKIAQTADGGLRDALGLLEQTVAYGQDMITAQDVAHVMGGVESAALLQLIEALITEDAAQVMERLMTWYSAGKDAARIVHEILQLLRDLFIVKVSKSQSVLSMRTGYSGVAARCSRDWLLLAVKRLGETYVQLRYIDQPRLALETALLGLLTMHSESKSVQPEPPQARQAVTSDVSDDQKPVNEPVQTPARASSSESQPPRTARPSAKATGTRKIEVLRNVVNQANPQTLEILQEHWDQALELVRSKRIQTHAWMTNGQAVVATANTVVLAFSSRIHRDAVMKSEDRGIIEEAISHVMEMPFQMLALLRADWEAFQKTLGESINQASRNDESDDDELKNQVLQVFGRGVVEIRDEE
jgi:DNA polymerase-3 subunit gamma/tau